AAFITRGDVPLDDVFLVRLRRSRRVIGDIHVRQMGEPFRTWIVTGSHYSHYGLRSVLSTVEGNHFVRSVGGKGLNQAIAAGVRDMKVQLMLPDAPPNRSRSDY
ncbi:MAG TPA: hypothetical protein VFL17_00725, partial [Anaerolineae bacterium]|nr:hypothetical protein [Anaerolineae bacterium]